MSTYRGYKDACNKTGNEAGKQQPYFQELDNIQDDKPSTRPAVVISSNQMATTTASEAMAYDIDRDDYNFDE